MKCSVQSAGLRELHTDRFLPSLDLISLLPLGCWGVDGLLWGQSHVNYMHPYIRPHWFRESLTSPKTLPLGLDVPDQGVTGLVLLRPLSWAVDTTSCLCPHRVIPLETLHVYKSPLLLGTPVRMD